MKVKLLTLAALAALTHAAGAAEPGVQSLEAVRAAAERGLRREIDARLSGVALGAAPLDSRLRLPECGTALQTQAQPPRGTQTRVLVRVACTSGSVWSLNVPVEVRREVPVLVLRRAVPRGETLGAADVIAQRRTIAGINSAYVAQVEDLAHRTTRRPLTEGTAITADALGPALLIHRGQSVTLTAWAGGIEVRAPGRALADAGESQRLRVQNLDSLKVVEGVAESEAVVRVSP